MICGSLKSAKNKTGSQKGNHKKALDLQIANPEIAIWGRSEFNKLLQSQTLRICGSFLRLPSLTIRHFKNIAMSKKNTETNKYT
jgi:hypothetical protein